MSLFSKILGILMIIGLLIASYGEITWDDDFVITGLIIFAAMPLINLIRQSVRK